MYNLRKDHKMPTKTTIQVWECLFCHETYVKKEQAEHCEKNHERKIKTDILTLCSMHISDTRYKKHCCCCAKLLIEYERQYDGHRNEAGDLKYNVKDKYQVLDGFWCHNCGFKLAGKIGSIQKQINDAQKH